MFTFHEHEHTLYVCYTHVTHLLASSVALVVRGCQAISLELNTVTVTEQKLHIFVGMRARKFRAVWCNGVLITHFECAARAHCSTKSMAIWRWWWWARQCNGMRLCHLWCCVVVRNNVDWHKTRANINTKSPIQLPLCCVNIYQRFSCHSSNAFVLHKHHQQQRIVIHHYGTVGWKKKLENV